MTLDDISYETLNEVIRTLQSAVSQSTMAFRVSVLTKYLEKHQDTEQGYCLSLILSFVMDEIIEFKNPRYYQVPETTFVESMRTYFAYKDKSLLPYSFQVCLHFMSSPKNLRLNLNQLAKLPFNYVSPTEWLVEHNISISLAQREYNCRLCNSRVTEDDEALCEVCKVGLSNILEYRIEDFIVDINEFNLPWLLTDLVSEDDYKFQLLDFEIEKQDGKLYFERTNSTTKRYQPRLPIKEFQICVQNT
jgi:hypothetical protein